MGFRKQFWFNKIFDIEELRFCFNFLLFGGTFTYELWIYDIPNGGLDSNIFGQLKFFNICE